MRSLLLAAATVFLAAPPPSATAQDAEATIRRAQAAWGNVRTLRAAFEQTIMNPLTGSAMLARGELQQSKPNKLAIVFHEPAGDRIVADGRHVWVYVPSAAPGQVIRMTNAQAGASNTDLIGQFLDTPRSAYDAQGAGTDTIGARPARAIILTAKPGEQLPFIRARVWVDDADGLIRRFESTDANGITRKVRLLTLSLNAAVESAAFVFTTPAGVRVVEP
ncbi:MAG: outer-membrane lipoprotein carrier protein LolA [Gemmatimonadaceae bacterium]